MSRGGKGSRGWLPGQTDRLVDTGKALGLAASAGAAAAAAASLSETLPPPLFPERSLRPFRWWDEDGRDLWLLQKAEELCEALAASPYNLDAPVGGEALQLHSQARTAAAAAGAAPPPPPLVGTARLLEHLACVRHSHAFPLELVVSRQRAARAAARGGGRSGSGLRAPVQQFLRAAQKAMAVAGGEQGAAGGGAGGGGGGAEGEEGEEEGAGAGEEEEEEEEDEEDFNDYTHDHYGDEDEGGGSEREGGGGGEEGDF